MSHQFSSAAGSSRASVLAQRGPRPPPPKEKVLVGQAVRGINVKPGSAESIKYMAAKNARMKLAASASAAAPVSLSTKTSIPTSLRRSAPPPGSSVPAPPPPIGITPKKPYQSEKQQTPPAATKQTSYTDFSVRVPKKSKKHHNLMRFNAAHKVDFAKWKSIKLHREDNSAQFKAAVSNREVMPKYGAGSEYGREEREEARRLKYGMHKKKYKPEDQPWVLKVGDRKYKGLKEGGVGDNSSYFVFTQAHDGHFDVYPVKQWYNFNPVQRYKALSAEEAELEFSRRNKIMNLFSVMVRKRMKVDEEAEEDSKKNQVNKALKMSEMDDWEDDEGSAESGDDEGQAKEAKTKKDAKKTAKKKKKDSDDEPMEDSDDGDDEGRELDYISDSSEPSEDEEEKKPDLPGVSEEAMEGESGSSSEEEEDEEKSEEGDAPAEGEKKKKSKKKKKEVKEEVKAEVKVSTEVKEEPEVVEKADSYAGEQESLPSESNSLKRKASFEYPVPAAKKQKAEVSSALLALAASEGITEEAVRKYLLRKPMTVAELLQKFKPKKTKIQNEDMVPIIAHILKKINPTKRNQQNKMYFFLKS